ncbi:MAG: crotonase/enoyl-CoA hydratase family protein [Polyangiaceae bacterium]|nr:crotonase/enoyl-CoA hydratase family protein [Polyangiaceae bacterium]
MSESSSNSYVSLNVDVVDHVATVTLTGPGKGNRMGPDFWREMPVAFERLGADDNVRVVVLRGKGEHFSVGLDLAGMGAELGVLLAEPNLAAERTKLHDLIVRMQRSITCVADCSKPVIAAISGWCIGGGVDLITACDVRLASSDAKLSVREVKLAIVADVGSLQRLPHIVGQGVARELAMTGDDISAERAKRVGLVNDVYATQTELMDAAYSMAKRIAKNPPLVVAGIKKVFEYGMGRPVSEGLAHVAMYNSAFLPSFDLREAIASFMEKREPQFNGR